MRKPTANQRVLALKGQVARQGVVTAIQNTDNKPIIIYGSWVRSLSFSMRAVLKAHKYQ